MLWLAEPEYERRMIPKIMHSHLIDGVIVASVLTDDPMISALVEGNLPFIVVGRHPTNHPISQAISYIDIDNAASAHDMVMHLLRLGRRRIATITGPQNMVPGVDRLTGYLSALRDRGLAADPNLIVESDFSEAGGQAAMQRLLPFEPDAVFVASDMMAVGALRTLREAGKRVPEDVAVASFDDMPFAARSEPPLTTVRQPVQRMGAVVAETLIDMIEHPSPTPRRIILPTEIMVRESCGSNLPIAKRSA
jgi:LacI family transcriptional regulator